MFAFFSEFFWTKKLIKYLKENFQVINRESDRYMAKDILNLFPILFQLQ